MANVNNVVLSPGLDRASMPYEYRSGDVAPQSIDSRRSVTFFHISFILCLILQRFGLMIGKAGLFVSLPVFLILCCWAAYVGLAKVREGSLMFGLAVLALIFVSIAGAISFPDNRVQISYLSPLVIVANTMLYMFGPTDRFDGRRAMEIFLFYARICTVAGIIQYFAQFAGIRIFSFAESFPFLRPVLIEGYYNVHAIVAYGSSEARANGFFLLEPSFFSQLLVVAISVEFFITKNFKWLPVYGIAYLVSQSGTGAVSLLFAIPIYLVLFTRESGRMVMFILAALVGVGLMALLLPDQFAAVMGRSGELGAQGSSGYGRYVEQFNSVAYVIGEWRALLIGYGPGAADRATFVALGSAGVIQKMTIDYGMVSLILYLGLMVSAFWRWDLSIVPPLALVIMIIGGGYVMTSPMIIMLLLVTCWVARRDEIASAGPALSLGPQP